MTTETEGLAPLLDGALKVMQHSLGLNQYGEGRQYRNHFVAGGRDVERCRSAVLHGYMKEHAATEISGGSPWFSVTPAGIEYVALTSPARPPEPKLTRSQQRYRRYREYGDMFSSFIEYCRWDGEPERSWNCR
jgi:hypothetical protein